ncbi:MAG TPA: NADP-dependent oxidoreductase [Caulobacteraceae bacterium]|nr:NADP-dependent oxidoreductase [Caulobacteraceae bacterium]
MSKEAAMKAVRIHEFGGPEVIHLEDLPTPNIGPTDILVEVHAGSVNPVDYKIRNGGYVDEKKLPITLGRDIAGEVGACGAQVTAFKKGDAVYAMLPPQTGGFAECVSAPAEVCAKKPERLNWVQAAATPLAALTAWQGLFDHGRLNHGQRILVHGASGGVGHFAVQFAVCRGAHVIATCRSDDRDFVRQLGAEAVVDYQHEDFASVAHDIDLVFDLIGGETRERSWAVLREGGTLVSTVGEPDQARAAQKKARGVGYLAQPSGAQLTEIGRLIDEGHVRPYIDRVYPMAASAEAERHLENDHVRGKVVLAVG